MAKHVKPTQEELKAQEETAIEEAEKLKDAPEEEPEEEVVEEETPTEEELEPEEEPEEEEAVPSKEIYKKKFSESSRENQRINAKNRVINKAIADASEVEEPTDDELVKEYSDWDMMSDVEKHFAKETVISRRWRNTIAEAKEQATKIERWNESVDEFIDEPKTLIKYPALEGKTAEFREFALTESNNNVPFNILTSAFLHDNQTKQVKNKGRMFEKGSGGGNEKPKFNKGTITLEEARKLRENDYNEYKRILIAGKIEQDF